MCSRHFVAVALSPGVNWLTSRRVPRALAILIMYVVLLVVVAGVGAIAVPSLAQQAMQLVHALQQPGGLTAAVDRMAEPLGLGGLVRPLHPQLDALPGQAFASIASLPTVTASTVGTITAILSVAVLGRYAGASESPAKLGFVQIMRRRRAWW